MKNKNFASILRYSLVIILAWIGGILQAQLPSFAKNNQDVLYQAMDNMIAIDLNGVNGELVTCKASNAQRVSRYSDSLYAVYPSSTETDCLLKLYYKNIIVEQVRVKIVPPLELKIIFGNEKDGVIHKKDLLHLTSFSMLPANGIPLPNHTFRIISGNITVLNTSGQLMFTGNLRDNVFSDAFIKILKDLTTGCKIILSNPRVVNHYNQHVQTLSYTEWRIVEN